MQPWHNLSDFCGDVPLLVICSLCLSRCSEQFGPSDDSPRSSLMRYRKACSSFCVWAAKTCLVRPSFL